MTGVQTCALPILIEDRDKAIKEKSKLYEAIAHYEAALGMSYPIECTIKLIDDEWRTAKLIAGIARAKGD